MAKPWEETWRQSEAYPGDVWGDCDDSGGIMVLSAEHVDQEWQRADAHARAKLAAAAPEMARLLLELEWAGDVQVGPGDGTEACCPSCHEPAPETIHFPARRVDAYTRTEARDEVRGGKHRDDCALVAVLRKAGVLT